MDDNQLSGPIPSTFTNLTDVYLLRLTQTDVCIPAGETALTSWYATIDNRQPDTMPTCEPAKPSGFTATPQDGSVRLEWQADDRADEWHYRFRAWDGSFGDWQSIAGSDGDTTQFVVTGLTNGTEYEFQVRARNTSGWGPASDVEYARPAGPGEPEAPGITNVVAGSSPGSLAITWTWTGTSCYITGTSAGYEVQYKKASVSAWRGAWEVDEGALANNADSGAYEGFEDYGESQTVTDTFTIDASAGHGAWGQVGVTLDPVVYDVRVLIYSPGCSNPWSEAATSSGTPAG